MDSYHNINDAYNNIGTTTNNNTLMSNQINPFRSNNDTDIDKIARQVNDNKKNKKISKDIYGSYRKKSGFIDNGLGNLCQNTSSVLALNNSGTLNGGYDITMANANNNQCVESRSALISGRNNNQYTRGIQAFNNLHTSNIDKIYSERSMMNGGFYSAQGDYSEINHPANLDESRHILGNSDSIDPNIMSGHSINDNRQTSRKIKHHRNKKKSQSRRHSSKNKYFFTQPDECVSSNLELSPNLSISDSSLNSSNSDGSTNDSNSSSSSSSLSSSSSSFSTMSFNTDRMDKLIKSKSKFCTKKHKKNKNKRHNCMEFDLNSVDSLESLDSSESLLEHTRHCASCKAKVKQLISKYKDNKSNCLTRNCLTNSSDLLDNINKSSQYCRNYNIDSSVDDSGWEEDSNDSDAKSPNKKLNKAPDNESDKNKSTNMGFYVPELKEIITVCLVGFLIIIILDLLMRYNK
jgi:hypothetical protein